MFPTSGLKMISMTPFTRVYSTNSISGTSKFLADTCPFWAHWYPCFGFLVMSSLVSKPEWVLPYSLFHRGNYHVHSPRSTSGAKHANLLEAGSAAGHFPTCINRGGTWLGFKRAIIWTEDERATIVPTTRLCKNEFIELNQFYFLYYGLDYLQLIIFLSLLIITHCFICWDVDGPNTVEVVGIISLGISWR